MPDHMTLPQKSAPDHGVSESSGLAQLRAYIADRSFKPGERLPSERVLCTDLGLNRAVLRRALQVLEQENRIWRHVGKGTFLTEVDPAAAPPDAISQLARQVSPADVFRARATLEPAIAREAALHASASDIAKMRLNVERVAQVGTWREYEALDNDFHRLIAESTGSTSLLALFDQLNTLRRMVSWGRMVRTGPRPQAEHKSFAEHARIIEEIALRDPDAAQGAMRMHLRSVEKRLLG
ncbi:DNA-binding FadR family transcriptional regulator [Roseinatronobacter thiooxidans]|uniref:DNA-binding FadR family transcriptional regulator n=1 Tax=Roseinatronobacter thiooxidans TaxID=121821 RepID=A0A2W7PYT7_9RHOB|nr:FCD domain-containing protein [Roseinatronobacter thiooxidans]PZX40703.1 DNA-binding FadR family transcriptional regulator [Roseinatronobacter thiooxidans]